MVPELMIVALSMVALALCWVGYRLTGKTEYLDKADKVIDKALDKLEDDEDGQR